MTDRNVRRVLWWVFFSVLVFVSMLAFVNIVHAQQTPWDQWDAPVCQCVCEPVPTYAVGHMTPTVGQTPTSTPEPTERAHSNRGIGNGPEGSDPGNSGGQGRGGGRGAGEDRGEGG